MDFFDRQEKARKGTARLVILFGAGVLALTLAVYLAVLLIFAGLGSNKRGHEVGYGYSYGYTGYTRSHGSGLWNPGLFSSAALGTLTVVLLGSLFKAAELSKGGSAVASMLGGVPVNPNTTDADERKLLNVVEEMAIASGTPVPLVYLLPKEEGINAFAAGHSTSDAAIGVTRGAVRLLNRDELQGVIAHEFSHILNGDMRLNLRLMGLVFGILCLAVIGRILLQTRGRKNPLPLLGLALVIIGWIGVIFGRIIQAAVSRQRECLADASAVQFTRNPLGLASALKKIGGLAQGSRLVNPQAAEASHMFFENGLRRSFLGLMNTHPPLIDRIRALDPSFDGKFPVMADTIPSREAGLRMPPMEEIAVSGVAGGRWSTWPTEVPPMIAVPRVIGSVGSPAPAHIRYAAELRNSFPDEIRDAARQTSGAAALIYALLLSDDEPIRRAQLLEIENAVSRAMADETVRLLPIVRQAALTARLPLVDMALPTLRQLAPIQFQQFRTAVEKLVEADGEIDLFEYMLQRVVLRRLAPEFEGERKLAIQFYSLRGLAGDCAVLLSGLAHIGGDDEAQRQAAFRAGAEPLEYAGQVPLPIVRPEECGLDRMDNALSRISQAVPQIKKNVLNGCALTVSHDGLIKEEEAELLRAIADALDCPMPPFVAQAA